MKDFIVIKTFNTRIEAEIIRGKLESNKIEAIINADDEGGMVPFPFQPNPKGVELLVNKKDIQKAKKLITNLWSS